MRYFNYLVKHKWYVMVECFKEGLYWQGITHDLDKFQNDFLKSYSSFMSSKRFHRAFPEALHIKTGSRKMNSVWLRHRKNSPHHWQYYCYGRKEPRQMPYKYVKEMICDWKGAMKAQGTGNLKEWYLYSRDFMILHEHTRRLLDKLMKV